MVEQTDGREQDSKDREEDGIDDSQQGIKSWSEFLIFGSWFYRMRNSLDSLPERGISELYWISLVLTLVLGFNLNS